VIFGTACIAWLTFWTTYRLTEYLYLHFLCHPW
jgi:hypothetical protein